jgi:integrase/recombinase XerD
MKKKIFLTRILHRDRWRILISFRYDAVLSNLVRQIKGVQYTNTHKGWCVDDTEENLEQLRKVIKDEVEIDDSGLAKDSKAGQHEAPYPEIEKPVHKSYSSAFNPLTAPVTTPVKNIIPDNEDDDEIIPVARVIKPVVDRESYSPVEFTMNEGEGKLIIRFTGRYDREWIRELKSYGRVRFNPSRLEWVLSWTRLKVDSLSDYFASQGVGVIVKKYAVTPEVKAARNDAGTGIRNRDLSEEILKGIENTIRFMAEKRYSSRSIETYKSQLELFFKYFEGKDPFSISEEDISNFFHDYIIHHGYSASYHNQLISAIKIFYQVNGLREVDSSSLVRPRRGRSLPKVFSKEEVKSILNASRNIKHRLILWMIYSCGLRRSELINIRLTDLDRSRGILNIRQAKGKIDRFIPVSEKVWEKVDEYRMAYETEVYLFEGQGGGRYSSESVYRVFKEALKRAGIKKDVGVHSLRHSYATHLHENGVDIRYIQELLGHKSTRTTEIYTHVSRRNLAAVRSPIDDIDL